MPVLCGTRPLSDFIDLFNRSLLTANTNSEPWMDQTTPLSVALFTFDKLKATASIPIWMRATLQSELDFLIALKSWNRALFNGAEPVYSVIITENTVSCTLQCNGINIHSRFRASEVTRTRMLDSLCCLVETATATDATVCKTRARCIYFMPRSHMQAVNATFGSLPIISSSIACMHFFIH